MPPIDHKIDSLTELETLFAAYPSEELPIECYRETRYVNFQRYNSLVTYELNFDPYKDIAKRCGMKELVIMRSTRTNRFYIGFINLGGHAAACEIRPVRLKEVKDYTYMERMFSNCAQELDQNTSSREDFDI